MNLVRLMLLLAAAIAACALSGCSMLGWKSLGWGAQDGGVSNNRNAELGSGLRPPGESNGKDMLGLDPRAREIEKNLGL